MIFLSLILVFFSGLTGLVYQITWQKYLSIYLGSHALSTTLTLSCFFFFLSAGYQFVGRYSHRLGKNKLMLYGYIEGLIGIYAIASPQVFSYLYEIWPSFASDSLAHFISSFLFALALMGLPTFLMGGTIPILTQGLSRNLPEGHKIHAWVYGINTFGAFVGSLFSGFYILEVFGLAQTLNLTGMLNCLIFIGALIIKKISTYDFSGIQPSEGINRQATGIGLFLSVSFLSGFLSFGVESLAIRVAGYALGSSNYTYSIIVSAFVFAIAVGSFLAAQSNEQTGRKLLLWTQVGICLTLVGLYFVMPQWPDIFLRVRMFVAASPVNFNLYWVLVFLCLLVFLFIPVALMGSTLPLLFQQMKSQNQFLHETAGRMYTYNSLGAVLGAIIAGYFAFNFLAIDQVFFGLIIFSFISAGLIAWRVADGRRQIASGLLATLVIFGIFAPHWRVSHFVPSRAGQEVAAHTTTELQRRFAELNNRTDNPINYLLTLYDPNTFTVVTELSTGETKSRALYVNAKPDADTGGDRETRTLTALVPLTFAKQVTDTFIIGLGTGMSAGIAASLDDNQSVTVAEIASGVIAAYPLFSQWNFGLENHQQKLTLYNDDAYKILKNSPKKYDLIFSEPSNTWVTGVEKIYTQEFLQTASQKLKPGGLYSQWFPLFAMTDDSFLSVISNFRSAFKYVTLFCGGGLASVILASNQPPQVDLDFLQAKTIQLQAIYDTIKVKDPMELMKLQILSNRDTESLAEYNSLEHSLYHPTLAFQSGRAYFSSQSASLQDLMQRHFFVKKQNESHERDLLWQTIPNLPEEFYSETSQPLNNCASQAIAQGRLTLAKNQRFPPTEVSEKIEHYRYLTMENPPPLKKRKPPEVKAGEKPPTPEEVAAQPFVDLFARFYTLRKLREKVFVKNVVQMAPQNCPTKMNNCLLAKLGLLEYSGHLTREQADGYARQLRQAGSEKIIDELFQQHLAAK